MCMNAECARNADKGTNRYYLTQAWASTNEFQYSFVDYKCMNTECAYKASLERII